MKFSTFAFGFVAALAVSSSALAGSGAPGQPPAGSGGSVVNPKFETSKGDIDIRNVPVDIMAGYYKNSGGSTGTSFKAVGGHEIFIFAREKGNSIRVSKPCADGKPGCSEYVDGQSDKISVFKVNAGGEVSAQLGNKEGKIVAYKIVSPSVGILGAKSYDVHDTGDKFQTNAAGSFELVSVSYENSKNSIIDTKTNAAVMEVIKANGQVAFKINDVNFDLCAGVKGQFKFGEIKFGERTTNTAAGIVATACAGVQIGKIANIRNEFNLAYLGHSKYRDVQVTGKNPTTGQPYTHWTTDTLTPASQMAISNTVSADKLGGGPVGAYWEYKSESAQSGGDNSKAKSVDTHTFGVKAIF